MVWLFWLAMLFTSNASYSDAPAPNVPNSIHATHAPSRPTAHNSGVKPLDVQSGTDTSMASIPLPSSSPHQSFQRGGEHPSELNPWAETQS